jgi:hypothetical protein
MVVGNGTAQTSVPLTDQLAATVVANAPIGVARGIYPGRVVWAHDAAATTWDGNTTNGTYWWDQNGADQARVDAMVSQSLRSMTGQSSDAAALGALFRSYNNTHGEGNVGYQSGQKIAIKINQNTADTYVLNGHPSDQNSINSNPQLIKSMLRQLVNQAGVPQAMITVYDASRCIADAVYVPNHSEFPAVHFADGYGGQGRELITWSAGNVISYAQEHTLGRQVPQQVMDASYLINMATMKDHGNGPTLCAKNMYGSIGKNNTAIAGSGAQGDHAAIYHSGGMGTYSTLVDLIGQPNLGEKTVLFMIDALYGAPGVAADPVKWNSAPLNGWWPSSIFMSQDGVAIDSVGFDFMNAEWGMADNSENYLHEAALANNPPSGTSYMPDGVIRLTSQGTQEHWNNASEMKYSRNLSPTGTGIELSRIEMKLTGTVIGTSGSYNNAGNTREKAFDGNIATFFDAPVGNGAWTGLDLGTARQVSTVRYYPRSSWAGRMVGGKFQGSNDQSAWTDLVTITSTPPYAWTELAVSNSTGFRYVRYLSPDNGWCNVAELEFYSNPGADLFAPTMRAANHLYQTSSNKLSFAFSEDVSASLAAADLSVQTVPPGASVSVTGFSYDTSTNVATFTLNTSLADGNYRATLPAGSVTDAAGNPLASDVSLDFFLLGGDANHDARVDVRDLYALATNWQGSGKIFSQGDFNYDGKVDVVDLTILARNWQKTVDGTVLSAATMPAILPQPTQPPAPIRPPARTAFKVVSLIQ